ncbi:DUF1877 family protein [Streptomyces sp. NPDC015661]|uniref:DUF1877 family protein n=1 Tax=Streptomyces sp. NPDC015661 TaxID=3364961 RepID=UPI0037021184
MSIYLHFRAVAESEIRDDHTWLAAFMYEAWERVAEECEAGIADAINKAWGRVNDFYGAARAPGVDSETSSLPIYGGRPVGHSADADLGNPPMMILDPPDVSKAADFLASVSFDESWRIAGAGFGGHGENDALFRQEFLAYHESLLAFYGQAASAGHSVVKVVWA